MNRRINTVLVAAGSLLVGVGLASAAQVQTAENDPWCREGGRDRDRYARHCEVREMTLPADRQTISVDAHPNGGIEVEGWDKDEIRLAAKVVAKAYDDDEAENLASRVKIETADTIHAEGPRTRRRESWWVSYRLWVPSQSNLELESMNGGISIEEVSGRIEFRTTNGGVDLESLGGDVRGKTTNGGLKVRLAGGSWDGRGLDVRTTNGGVELDIPEGYNAELETGTTNGGIHVNFPITVQGRINRQLRVTLGDGGAPVRATTTNGGVRVRQR